MMMQIIQQPLEPRETLVEIQSNFEDTSIFPADTSEEGKNSTMWEYAALWTLQASRRKKMIHTFSMGQIASSTSLCYNPW